MSEPITADKIIAALVRETDDHGMTRIQLGEVQAIAAELDRLRADAGAARGRACFEKAKATVAQQEVDRLRAENEALRADALRYRWLKDTADGWRVLKFDGFGAGTDVAIDAELAAPHSK